MKLRVEWKINYFKYAIVVKGEHRVLWKHIMGDLAQGGR